MPKRAAASMSKAKKKRSKAPVYKRGSNLMNTRIAGMLGLELKNIDHNRNVGLTSADLHMIDPSSDDCFGVGRGDTQFTRIGSECEVRHLFIEGRVSWQIPDIDMDDVVDNDIRNLFWKPVKLFLVEDKQTNGVQMTPQDLIDDGGAGNDPCTWFRNLSNTRRFVVHDVIEVDPNDHPVATEVTDPDTTSGKRVVFSGNSVRFKLKYNAPKGGKGITLKYTDGNTTGSCAGLLSSSFHLVAASHQPNVADTSGGSISAQVSIAYSSRLRFYG